MNRNSVGSIRKEYKLLELDESSVNDNPIIQFEEWFKEAVKREGDEANAATLSTIGLDGHPEGRIVLLKFYSGDGFTFYTNYNSNKGQELERHPFASMTFYWRTLERQVRVRGEIAKVDPVISDEYFNSRPKTSRIGAWSSPQSQVIESRTIIEQNELKYAELYKDQENIPRPEHWGGFIIQPQKIEFWQGRPSRLHDRIVYQNVDKKWVINRLAP